MKVLDKKYLSFAFNIGLVFALSSLLCLVGCTRIANVPLMPTPVIYQSADVGPVDRVPESERYVGRKVYYVTTRQRAPGLQHIDYNNTPDERVNVGMAMIGFGDRNTSWSDLSQLSRQGERDSNIDLSIMGLFEAGSFRLNDAGRAVDPQGGAKWLMSDLDKSIEHARDQDLLIYVHGALVNFYNACAFAAQLDHFMSRSMTSLAFSWPTRQYILAYGIGGDVERAYQSASALTALIEQVAAQTRARRIHILSWSAGARLVTASMVQLRQRYPNLDRRQLADTFRLGTLYYAASDIPVKDFIDALPVMNELSDRIVITASSHDGALKSAKRFMGDGARLGDLAVELTPEQQDILGDNTRIEYINLSAASEDRGFDITGHNYWFNHPWASTDALLSIRTDLAPEERGLVPGGVDHVWQMPSDYPDRVRKILLMPASELRK